MSDAVFDPLRSQAKVGVIFLTSACDMHCPYCGADEHFPPLSALQARNLLDALAQGGYESVVLGGGEPFLWPGDLRALAGHAHDLGLLTQVGTNLNTLPEEAPRWGEVDRWVLPLESSAAEAHDALRPGPPSHHAHVLRCLDAFQAAGATVTVSSVARQGATADLHSVALLLRERRATGLKLHAWHVYRFQAMGRGGRYTADRFGMSDEDWKFLAAELKERHSDLPVLLRPDMLHSKQVSFFWNTPRGLWRQGPLSLAGPVELTPAGGLALGPTLQTDSPRREMPRPFHASNNR